jgi:hypothetical protein
MSISNYSFSQDATVDLFNYEENKFETVDLISLSKDNYRQYLPESATIQALFDAYVSKGEPVNLALLSTLQDLSNAKLKITGSDELTEMYNFKLMKPELVNLTELTKSDALSYIPQSEYLFNLFELYIEDFSVEESLYKTLIDTNTILLKESKVK